MAESEAGSRKPSTSYYLGRPCSTRHFPRTTRLSTTKWTRSRLAPRFNRLAESYSKVEVADTLDALKAARFHWATRSGVTISFPMCRTCLPRQAFSLTLRKRQQGQQQYEKGLITDSERRQELIEIWTRATDEVATPCRRTSLSPTRFT